MGNCSTQFKTCSTKWDLHCSNLIYKQINKNESNNDGHCTCRPLVLVLKVLAAIVLVYNSVMWMKLSLNEVDANADSNTNAFTYLHPRL